MNYIWSGTTGQVPVHPIFAVDSYDQSINYALQYVQVAGIQYPIFAKCLFACISFLSSLTLFVLSRYIEPAGFDPTSPSGLARVHYLGIPTFLSSI